MSELDTQIRELIALNGPLNVAQYMGLVLGHPTEGYYQRKDPFGVEGDFTTSPEISQLFGEMVGLFLADYWQKIGCPPNISVVELGPGRGTLMRDLLRATRHVPGFHEAMDVHLVETSVVLRKMQHDLLNNSPVTINWHLSIETLPKTPLFVIANEFFDALPIHQFVKTNDGWRERMINVNGEELNFTVAPTSTLAHAHIDVRATDVEDGALLEVCPAMVTIASELSERIVERGGAMLVIDYGYEQPGFKDTLQALMKHAYHPVLSEPGLADVTAHVNFSALADVAIRAEATPSIMTTQQEFLGRMGIHARAEMLCKKADEKQKADILSGLERLIDPAQMGTLFKCMAVTDGAAKPAGF